MSLDYKYLGDMSNIVVEADASGSHIGIRDCDPVGVSVIKRGRLIGVFTGLKPPVHLIMPYDWVKDKGLSCLHQGLVRVAFS
ncbi:hypothetical protein DI09_154p90 [Mitosporidium daphniae]|uniref:Uncharacterized protein n=1 Tax=Mitosporidium daphniae TaxID=1485682 RepID=A0A098VUQ4_9MICR|nr:uncharacterized protein DI09_154p90 [Mitosporidium daphniae]KGG52599.1 hypothetical protein DI09_154p90 [Mitosporidium daphniae]|eukprot:XP_013239035.1 uncharacterized protein DI09_154p90 [Mitosporidium daphniae]